MACAELDGAQKGLVSIWVCHSLSYRELPPLHSIDSLIEYSIEW